jgi:hypothetical protein
MASMKHTRSSVDAMIGELHKNAKPEIKIVGIEAMSNEGYARVTASVAHQGKSREDHSLVISALTTKFGNKVRAVDGSFHVLASDKGSDTFTGIVSCNPESVAYDEDLKGYRALSGNMFMDDDEMLWSLQKTESGDILIKSRGRDDADVMSELMSSLSSAVIGTSAFESVSSSKADACVRNGVVGGDFVIFVDPNTEQVKFGSVIASVEQEDGSGAGLCVLASDEGSKSAIIDRGMVLSSFEDVDFSDEGLVGEEEAVAANGHSLDEIEAYYSRVFQRDPAYFEKFMARWKSHVFA